MLHCCRSFSVLSPRSVPWYNPVLEVYTQFLGLHGLVCTLTCTVNSQTLYKQMCAFFQIMSDQLNLPQVDSGQVVETSVMISGNAMHLSSILSVTAAAVNTHVHVIFFHLFLFFIFNTFAKDFKQISITLSLCFVLFCFVLVEENNEFNPCWKANTTQCGTKESTY